MPVASRDSTGCSDARYHYRHGAIVEAAIAELAYAVRTPAMHSFVCKQGAGMSVACGYCDRIGKSVDLYGYVAVIGDAGTELPVFI
jgi:hypothetical protein